jgi:hypothetical protein
VRPRLLPVGFVTLLLLGPAAGAHGSGLCPTVASLDGRDAGAVLDVGWTGAMHGVAFPGWRFGVTLGACDGAGGAPCGVCPIQGLAPAAEFTTVCG